MATAIGRNARPASVAVKCCTCCMNNDRNAYIAYGANPNAAEATFITAKCRSVNIRTGSMGDARCHSTITKTVNSTAAPARAIRAVTSRQPVSPNRISPNERVPNADMPSTCPGRSNAVSAGSDDSGTTRTVPMNPTIPTGTPAQNMAGQPYASIRKPPSTGPAANPTADAAAHTPIRRARSAGSVNVWVKMDNDPGMSMEAPTPWTTRPTMRLGSPVAKAHSTEPNRNSPTPNRNTRLRPKRSPRAPPVSINADRQMAKALTTHCRPARLVPRSSSIAGRATLTMLMLMMAMKLTSASVARMALPTFLRMHRLSLQLRNREKMQKSTMGAYSRCGSRHTPAASRSDARRYESCRWSTESGDNHAFAPCRRPTP